jgi:hypothetical protein
MADGFTNTMDQVFLPDSWADRTTDSMTAGIKRPQDALHAAAGARQPGLLAGANAALRANPYSTIVANQARPAQEALYAQMRAQQAGPSLASMQGARAQGQNVQAALGAGAGRPVMAQAGSIGAGLAADTGSGVLAEQMLSSQGLGNVAAGMRGADLNVAGAQSSAGLQQRSLDDAMRQFYAGQGTALNDATRNADLEYYKLIQRLQKKNTGTAGQTGKDAVAAGATALDIVL